MLRLQLLQFILQIWQLQYIAAAKCVTFGWNTITSNLLEPSKQFHPTASVLVMGLSVSFSILGQNDHQISFAGVWQNLQHQRKTPQHGQLPLFYASLFHINHYNNYIKETLLLENVQEKIGIFA